MNSSSRARDGSLLVVSGPPGAGKSTISAALVEHLEPSMLVEGDAFFGFLRRGAIDPWLPESHQQNTVITAAAADTAVSIAAAGYHTVFDGVVGPWFIGEFTRRCLAAGVELDYVLLIPSVGECQQRVAHRPDHRFSDPDATARMHENFYRADIDDRHVLRPPPVGIDDTVAAVEAARQAGNLRVGGD